jgi:hypothetical protein
MTPADDLPANIPKYEARTLMDDCAIDERAAKVASWQLKGKVTWWQLLMTMI